MPGFDFIDKIVKPFKKGVEPLMRKRGEDEIIAAINERIPIEGEEVLPPDADKAVKREEEFRRLQRRLEYQFEGTGVSTDEMLRYYDRPLYAIILLKYLERYKKKGSQELKDRLVSMGFLLLQNNVWVLPPSKTPQELRNQEDIKVWMRGRLTKSLRKDYQYVMPFLAVVDMRRVVAERYRVVKPRDGKRIFSILDRKDLLPASYVYSYIKRKGFSLEGMIRGGDLVFLASAFADPETIGALKQSRAYATSRIQKLLNTDRISLSYVADLHEKELGGALEEIVKHPVDVARRLAVEAQYWERFLDGIPATGGDQGAKDVTQATSAAG